MKCKKHVCESKDRLMLPSCVMNIKTGNCDRYRNLGAYAASMGCLSVSLVKKGESSIGKFEDW